MQILFTEIETGGKLQQCSCLLKNTKKILCEWDLFYYK